MITTSTSKHNTYRTGVALLLLSAVVFSSAGIFTKYVAADGWNVIFWRGLSAAIITFGFAIAAGKFRAELRAFDLTAVFAVVLMGTASAAFISSFKHTSVANVALLWACAPFVAALQSWLFLREAPTKRVLACSTLALVGVAITLSSSFGSGNLFGDMLALIMVILMAGTMVLYRARPGLPTMTPTALSSVMLLPVAAWFTPPSAASVADISVLILFGLVFAIASVLLIEGAKWVPSAQAALLGALETPLAPIWAFLILSEKPTMATLIGGGVIMTAIILSQRGTRNRETL
ncbi:MAG: DMT family transporter [Pikeienuella sp.]